MTSRLKNIYSLFSQSTLKPSLMASLAHNKTVRFRSSASHGEIVPYLNTSRQLPLRSIFSSLKNEYRIRQIAFDHELTKTLNKGIEKYNNMSFHEAITSFEEIIKAFLGDEIAELSDNQKAILAKAFTYSAKILCLGTTDDTKLSLSYLEQAIKLIPDYDEAINMKNSIMAEYRAYQP
ncbi:MAG TPA: hypothetical protein VHA13_04745 [Gammaproteobacteria bacterium]|nr:hypothetical protein [Gammaproteobacteria bacterium]